MTPLPCPFCGSDPRVQRTVGGGHYVVCSTRCMTDGPATEIMPKAREAIAAWNTRADPVRAALAVPGVAGLLDLIHGGFRDHDIAPATQRTLDALRVLADAAKEASDGR